MINFVCLATSLLVLIIYNVRGSHMGLWKGSLPGIAKPDIDRRHKQNEMSTYWLAAVKWALFDTKAPTAKWSTWCLHVMTTTRQLDMSRIPKNLPIISTCSRCLPPPSIHPSKHPNPKSKRHLQIIVCPIAYPSCILSWKRSRFFILRIYLNFWSSTASRI